jgi:acrylyl-CoA reductase (NADPH)
MDSFRALLAEKSDSGYSVAFKELTNDDLPKDGEVLLDVSHSSVNYKDGLAVTGKGKIVRRFPMVLGIDLAGTVIESTSTAFVPGDRVVGTGQGLGESDWGGYTQRQRVKADAIAPLPRDLSVEEAMRIGTAGLTAMLCVMALDHHGIDQSREVVVTGAAGGVGSIAVMLLAKNGYRVAASTGRPELADYLKSLGAETIVAREELSAKGGPLQTERWAGAVDTVGGETLANLLAQTRYEGAIAACGMAGGGELTTTVWPLILRNVALLGVSSLRTSKHKRILAWARLAKELDRDLLASISRTEPLSKIFELSEEILAGKVKGRVVVST